MINRAKDSAPAHKPFTHNMGTHNEKVLKLNKIPAGLTHRLNYQLLQTDFDSVQQSLCAWLDLRAGQFANRSDQLT